MKTRRNFMIPLLEGLFFIILIADIRYEFLSKNMLFMVFALHTPVMFIADRKKWKEDNKKSSFIFMVISFLLGLGFIIKIISNFV